MTVTAAELRSEPSAAVARGVILGPVAGGERTNPLWTSQVDNAPFAAALEESLRTAGLLAERDGARYELKAILVKLDQPLLGLNMTVKSEIRYVLTDRAGAVVLDEVIAASHTATMGEAFAGVKRLRLANEGSARKNIAELIQRLNTLEVKPSNVSM
jgi:hypothetical protein